jgi:hypothetical protein
MDDRDAFSDTVTETQDNKFGEGYEAFQKLQMDNGRRTTVIGPNKDSTTRSGPPDPFSANKDDEIDQSFTEPKGINPPDM